MTDIGKFYFLIWLLPIIAFILGMMWQYATWQLEQERGDDE